MDWLIKKVFGDVLPTDEMIRWQFDTFAWLMRYRGGYAEFKRSRKLVLPLDEAFPLIKSDGHAKAVEIFEHVKRYARMEEWNCRVEAHDDEQMAQRIEEQRRGRGGEESEFGGAAGTFSMAWDHSDTLITYSPAQLDNLASLVATFAHELSHFYLATVPFDPPKGPVAEEYATDLCAVSMGFGIFLANTNKRYYQGAVAGKQGYLGEVALSYSLAIFTELRGVSEREVTRYLKPNPKSFFKSAVSDIRKRWTRDIETLRQVQPHERA